MPHFVMCLAKEHFAQEENKVKSRNGTEVFFAKARSASASRQIILET